MFSERWSFLVGDLSLMATEEGLFFVDLLVSSILKALVSGLGN
jgi:hypothetical protein